MEKEEYWLVDFETMRVIAKSKDEAYEKVLRMLYNGDYPEIAYIEPDRREPLMKFDY